MVRRDAAPYPNELSRSVLIAVTFLLACGCKCGDPKAEAEALRQADLASLPQSAGSLQDQLNAEAGGRPTQTATLEGLIAALAKGGVTFTAPHQAYGKKLLASFCASADSTDGMIVTVCEYPSPEQAQRGQAEAKVIGALLAGWQSRVSKKSVLQLVARSDTPPEQVAKVLSTFDGL